MKLGDDVVSRYQKTLARTNISENPVVSTVARLLSMQVTNAAVVYRLFLARRKQILPRNLEDCDPMHRGYSNIRHRVTKVLHLVPLLAGLQKNRQTNIANFYRPKIMLKGIVLQSRSYVHFFPEMLLRNIIMERTKPGGSIKTLHISNARSLQLSVSGAVTQSL